MKDRYKNMIYNLLNRDEYELYLQGEEKVKRL